MYASSGLRMHVVPFARSCTTNEMRPSKLVASAWSSSHISANCVCCAVAGVASAVAASSVATMSADAIL